MEANMSFENDYYSPIQLFAEIEAYANTMDKSPDLDILRTIEEFDETLLSEIEVRTQSIPSPLVAPSVTKMSLPSPSPAPPNSLYTRLLHELDFVEGPSILARLEKINVDLFSCFPHNKHLYEHAKILSVSPSEVLEELSKNTWTYTALNLNEHGEVALPMPPTTKADLPSYVDDIQNFYLGELEAREKSYATMFYGYCRALAEYIRQSAIKDLRDARVEDKNIGACSKARQYIAERYYREAARFANVLYVHLYLSTTRDVSQRLEASQMGRQNIFVYLKCEWLQERHFHCLFQPVIFNHGVVIVEGRVLTAPELRAQNYIRSEFGLPLIRCKLVEEPDMPLISPPPFSGDAPRASVYLLQCIRSKLEVYSLSHPPNPQLHVHKEHVHVQKLESPPNYGTTVEALLMDSSDRNSISPGDPVATTISTL
uniref:MDV alpha TIF n=1 Tax=Gallus gallus TaxID=9031 RepID=Q90603_CHICK|nr:alpha-transinducing factor homolog - Marek's disease virus [Gallid alphaherpesvirus 2]CAA51787.1 MDV alpha TIF [Gallus gallus]